MHFKKEFTIFLYKFGAIKFDNFILSSGNNSSYYVDLKLVPSYPYKFKNMIKHLQDIVADTIGFNNFDAITSIPTGGLLIATAISTQMLKPLIYTRVKAKNYGSGQIIEGHFNKGIKALMVDDVATTGGSMIDSIEKLRKEQINITDAFVIVNRMEGASDNLHDIGVKLHHVIDISEISQILYDEQLISEQTYMKVNFNRID